MLLPATGYKVKRRYSGVMTTGLRVGDVARAAGVSTATVRHYERLRLLPRAHRTPSGYRVYPPGAVDRVRLVRGAVEFGFSLRELADYLVRRDSGGSPCRDVRLAGDQLLAAADREIARLQAARDRIAGTLVEWDRRLAAAAPGQPARLLETLTSAAPGRTSRNA